jgi:phosphoribosyl-ATP pyrophosphohydrolase/phosphoribosyl-AMP cyclohydrolase
LNNLNFNEKGLIPAIVQDEDTGDVLMLGYMNDESLRRTLSSGEVWFFSRDRQELWHKGATSGNKLKVVSIRKDCENNSLLVKAQPTGPTCHTGHKSCFYRDIGEADNAKA